MKVEGIGNEVHGAEAGGGAPETSPTAPAPPASGPTPPAVSKAKLKLSKLKRNPHKGVVFIRVHVSGRGRVVLGGAEVRHVVRTPKVARSLWIPVRPKAKAIRALDAKGDVKVKVKIVFIAAAGGRVTDVRKLTLVKK